MDFRNRYPGIDKYAVTIIKYKAKQLSKQDGFTSSDRDDLEQELVVDLLHRLPKYQKDRAELTTFIACIVERKIITIIKSCMAGIRDYHLQVFSLNEYIQDDDGNQKEHIDQVGQDDYFRKTGKYFLSQQEQLELSLDIKEVIFDLPPKLRRLSKRLPNETITEISKNMGISRQTVYQYIKQLREFFEEKGFGNYF